MTDSDSSDCDLLVQALPVPDMESDEPPDIQKAMASPEEYIRLVRYEAASYPSVLHAPIDAADVCPSPLTTNNNASVSPTFISNAYDELLTTFVDLVQEYRALKSLVTEDGKQPLSSDALENPNLLDQPPTFRWIAHLSRPELFAVLELVTSKCTKKRWKSSMTSHAYSSEQSCTIFADMEVCLWYDHLSFSRRRRLATALFSFWFVSSLKPLT
ncbi:hypothetical protein CRM22_006762 [Opisthorchis felineus]|uniref:Uncharacterized protein n=1 Tax=Opisthorchis felineus TaxID=147828 RepID=A0A4S2LJB8_OPIFE|nr:hypothetical protein CRM22_006762 [Opisthorchis felineus]